MGKVANLELGCYFYGDYYKKLKEIYSSRKKHEKITEIPILLFETSDKSIYHKYSHMLKEFMADIQIKIKKDLKNKKLPDLCALETVILLHMIEANDNGIYLEIQAMDIYSIMFCYDECSIEINKNHPDKCLCKKKFTEGNNYNNEKSYTEIRKSIKNHYEKTEQIKEIYQNYSEIISNKYKSSKFTYNIEQLVLLTKCGNNFKLLDCYQMLAYSKKKVIHFIIKPQFNKLNFNEIMINAIFNNFMLNKCDNENYRGKKIITCILTLDLNEPLIYEFDINSIHCDLISYTKQFLTEKYQKYHLVLHDFYNFCMKNKPKNKSSIDYTCEELDKHQTETRDALPLYMLEYFHTVKKNVKKIKNKNAITDAMSTVTDKELFLEEIEFDLTSAIDQYLGINNEDNVINY